jgi:hypothetical protein
MRQPVAFEGRHGAVECLGANQRPKAAGPNPMVRAGRQLAQNPPACRAQRSGEWRLSRDRHGHRAAA